MVRSVFRRYYKTSVLHAGEQVEMYPPGRLVFLRPFKGKKAKQTVWDAVWIEAAGGPSLPPPSCVSLAALSSGRAMGSDMGTRVCGVPRCGAAPRKAAVSLKPCFALTPGPPREQSSVRLRPAAP